MELFHKIVIIVAIVLFVISLTWFGIQIRSAKSKDSSVYPPTFDTIPDFWTIHEPTGHAIVPTLRNAPRVPLTTTAYDAIVSSATTFYNNNPGYTPGYTEANASGKPPTVNFADPSWKTYGTGVANRVTDCIYQEWANRVGITWDGITNYNQCT